MGTDDAPGAAPEQAFDSLRELEAAAREVVLRSGPSASARDACSSERRIAAFALDALFGFVALAGALLCALSAGVDVAVGESLAMLVIAGLPLLYSSTDWLVGNTLGKSLLGIRFERSPELRKPILCRWAIKGSPFILAAIISAGRLAEALFASEPRGRVSEVWSVLYAWLLLGGAVWWVTASVTGTGRANQTLPDLLAGTRLRCGAGSSTQRGFEPVIGAGRSA